MRVALGTIVTADYLPCARAVAESFRRHAPAHTFHVIVVDRPVRDVPLAEGLDVRSIDSLDAAAVTAVRRRYANDPDALRWSLKPVLMLDLLERDGTDAVLWVDPDMFAVGDCAFLWEQLQRCAVLLSPHWRSTEPAADPTGFELNFRDGIYNGGLVGATRAGIPALQWWSRACQYECMKAPERGLFVDQRYLDLLHSRFIGVDVIRHRGVNVAAWNRVDCARRASDSATSIETADDSADIPVRINGTDPIVCIHFTARTIRDIQAGKDPLLAPHLAAWLAALRRHGRDPGSDADPAPAAPAQRRRWRSTLQRFWRRLARPKSAQ